MGGLGGVESAGAGPSPRVDPTLILGIDGTDGGHLSSVYDWLRVTGNGGATLRSSRARPMHH